MHGHDQGATRPPKSFRRNEVRREHHAIAVGSDEQRFERPQNAQQPVAAQGQIVRNRVGDVRDRRTAWQVVRDLFIVRMHEDAAPVQTKVQIVLLAELSEANSAGTSRPLCGGRTAA